VASSIKNRVIYYVVDTGIRNQLTGLSNTDYGHILEKETRNANCVPCGLSWIIMKK
jgi:hypothetical protein